ncbi:uncharacterized protein L3040_005725 [Drepanopeziza brunnea f. sp. 'multigermtubi']|uniref:Uncharacterized protein n=1 Tax=Marssonina brunnea f. sp. multigermtubi (strain MB_m1) TaxID=1072389 RepID=K1X0P9_MARBU|nr:uncharacterized protein MBM_07164 [Drepanopeziza brunnea f. sp. 'multigermtubi' MB_m1]EKD14443.1 hypothetical protein MBM_07164 [Drepanopeziza brunnea f. sp. 'multigermtubi' MB_m1]KAJ5041174.1 hypothetical protein L3040_005725 [Drepanopeziza brunnea f. sp. 'multigermtubi']
MVQGTLKSKKLTTATARESGRRQAVLGPKRGARTIAPKKQVLVRNAKMTKKHSAGLTAMTERTLGAKAGHLELLKGGKKNKDAKDGKDKKGNEVEARKGGTKKFG